MCPLGQRRRGAFTSGAAQVGPPCNSATPGRLMQHHPTSQEKNKQTKKPRSFLSLTNNIVGKQEPNCSSKMLTPVVCRCPRSKSSEGTKAAPVPRALSGTHSGPLLYHPTSFTGFIERNVLVTRGGDRPSVTGWQMFHVSKTTGSCWISSPCIN